MKRLWKIAAAAVAGVLLTGAPASATSVTISDVTITPRFSNTEPGLRWTATPWANSDIAAIQLTEGGNWVQFNYAFFQSGDFPMALDDTEIDDMDVNFKVTPPGLPFDASGVDGNVTGHVVAGQNGTITVQFNEPDAGYFQVGNVQIRFNDRTVSSGSQATLSAQARLVSTPAPEPGTMALGATALAGAAIARRRRRR